MALQIADNFGRPGQAVDEPPGELSEHRPTWAPVNLGAILDGSHTPAQPSLLTRKDGVCLLYPGLTHSLHGESESGKSLIMQYATAEELRAGRRVAYLDYESDAVSVVDRLIMFGAPRAAIAEHLVYVQPELDPLTSNTAEAAAYGWLTRQSLALVVIDGVTGALVASGAESINNDQVTAWSRRIPEYLARKTGAAVVMIDHVPKDAQTRGRFAIGAQAKLGRITGAAFSAEPRRPVGRGLRGIVEIRVAKDRPGQLRQHGGPQRPSDRTQEIARFVLDSEADPDHPAVALVPPERDVHGDGNQFRPTAIMEHISRYLEVLKAPVSTTTIETDVPGRAAVTKRQALDLLVTEGFVKRQTGERRAKLHTSLRPYRQVDDPKSDAYVQPDPD